MLALQALLLALPAPFRRLPLTLYLFAALALFSVLVAAPLWMLLDGALEHSLGGHQLEQGEGGYQRDLWTHLELNSAEGLSTARRGALWVGLLWVVLSFTVLSAGTFWVLADRARPARLAEFLGGAGRLFGRFLRLAVLYAVALVVLSFLNRLLSGLVTDFLRDWRHRQASAAELGWVLHAKTGLMALLLGWLAIISGLAKARAARLGETFVLGSFLRATVTSLRHPLSTPALAATGPALHFALLGLYLWARDRLPAEALTFELGRTPLAIAPDHLFLALAVAMGLLWQGVLVYWTAAVLRFHELVYPQEEGAPPTPEEPRPLTVVDRPLPRTGGAR